MTRPLPHPDKDVTIRIRHDSNSVAVDCHIGTTTIITTNIFGAGRASVARSIIDQFLNGEHTPEGL